MIRLSALVIPAIVLTILISTAGHANAAATPGNLSPIASPARATAQDGIAKVVDVLKDRKLDRDARAQKLRDLMEDRLDFDTFARLSIGPTWRDWNDDQRTQFIEEFKRHMLGVATKSTNKYDDEEVVVVGDEPEKNGDCTIRCRVLGKMKDGVQEDIGRLDFRLRQKDDHWKVIDIHVAGISLANTFRAQFLVIMKDGGVDKLLKMLHDKNGGGDQKPSRTADAEK